MKLASPLQERLSFNINTFLLATFGLTLTVLGGLIVRVRVVPRRTVVRTNHLTLTVLFVKHDKNVSRTKRVSMY